MNFPKDLLEKFQIISKEFQEKLFWEYPLQVSESLEKNWFMFELTPGEASGKTPETVLVGLF